MELAAHSYNMENDYQKQIDQINNTLRSLSADYYNGNFSDTQDFNKRCNFNARLKVPVFAATPATGVIGELISVGGKLYVCSAVNTWVVAGTQS